MSPKRKTVDEEFAKRLAEHYAPEIRFDSREEYFPCSIDWLAANSGVWCTTRWDREGIQKTTKDGDAIVATECKQKKGREWVIDCEIAGVGEIAEDPQKASSCRCNLNHHQDEGGEDVVAIRHQHRLRPIESKWGGQSEEEMREGSVACYYSVVPAPRSIFDDNHGYKKGADDVAGDVYEITYYMIYAYNGNIFNICGLGSPGIKIGTHEGDVEQVVIYVKDPDLLQEGDDWILSQFQFRHAGEGRFVEQPQMMTTKGLGSHFVVYTACESHASYPKAGWTFRIFGFANDRHNGRGRKWQTWKNLQPIHNTNWIDFDGYFGGVQGLGLRSNIGRPGFSSTACRLPAILPDRIVLASPMHARKQIPKTLIEAVQKQPKKPITSSSTTSNPQQEQQKQEQQHLHKQEDDPILAKAPTELLVPDPTTTTTTTTTTTEAAAYWEQASTPPQEPEELPQQPPPPPPPPQPHKVVTFCNSGTDPIMEKAELYCENSLWGPLGHNDEPTMVGSYAGHRWYIVANGVYVKLFTIGEEPEQTFTF